MTDENVYRRAIEVIQKQGWHQGTFSPVSIEEHGPVCMAGALDVAHGNRVFGESYRSYTHLRRVVPDGELANWNDDPERTRRQVLAKLGNAARPVEAEEGR